MSQAVGQIISIGLHGLPRTFLFGLSPIWVWAWVCPWVRLTPKTTALIVSVLSFWCAGCHRLCINSCARVKVSAERANPAEQALFEESGDGSPILSKLNSFLSFLFF